MKGKKIKDPLKKRTIRELKSEWRKYAVVAFFLILMIGFVSGMYVANESMIASAEASVTKYKLEYGHFELKDKASNELLEAIASGEKADVKQFYLDKAKNELDEKFEDEFTKEFNSAFNSEFDSQFATQVKQTLIASGLDEAAANAMLDAAISQAKQDGTYSSAYDSAYSSAYWSAYNEAYNEAWKEVQSEVEDEYAKAEEKYALNDPDFTPVKVTLYENFYRNEDEDNNNDGISDGTVRIYIKNDEINMACILEGELPQNESEIAIDRMHANNVGVKTGDTITVGGEKFKVTGLIAYVNYSTLHEKSTDLMFDAIKFNVGMLTQEGFDRLNSSIHYSYAWMYDNEPADNIEQKALSDDFMKALLTQSVVFENDIKDYLPRYSNPAINFATEDMGSDKAMGGVLLDILIVIIAFIFAITITNTITKDAGAIGTLRASGYTKGELLRHYISMPVAVTLISALIGNILGYTVFKNTVVSMYYNSYSLPTFETVWNLSAFIKTTLIPLALMFAVNIAVIAKMLQHTPLEFLRHDLRKSKRQKAVKLPAWKFFRRFRLRIIMQNASNYLILFAGIFFIAVMLAMAVGMPNTLKYYQDNAPHMMFAKYQYVLTSWENEDDEVITTQNEDAEKFSMTSLIKRSDAINEEVSVYGVADDSSYVQIDKLKSLDANKIYISEPFSEKYDLKEGDEFILWEKYEDESYTFTVAGIYDKYMSIAVFMPLENYNKIFDLDSEEFSGYFTNSEISDIDDEYIATVITKEDITKMCDQMDHSMGAYMQYFQVLCMLLSAVMIYLLSTLIIEKNENAISMTKILGYENGEIARLYLTATTIVLLAADAVSVLLGSLFMKVAWKKMLYSYSGWFAFKLEPEGYLKMFLFILIGYLMVMLLNFRRIKNIPMDEALKNIE